MRIVLITSYDSSKLHKRVRATPVDDYLAEPFLAAGKRRRSRPPPRRSARVQQR